jgi:hypothetical protein
MLFMGWRRSCSVARHRKTRHQGGQKCGSRKRRNMVREGVPKLARTLGATCLLNIDKEVALQDILSFFVLLGLFVRFILPPKGRSFVVSRNANGSR